MGILDALRSADENAKRIIKEFKRIEGLEEVVNGILELGNSKIYEKFYQAFKLEGEIWESGADFTEEEKKNIRLINLANENMSSPALHLPVITDLIAFINFYVMYRFLEDIYYINAGRKMMREDLMKITFKGLPERITFLLDNFDSSLKVPEPTAKFFQTLNKVKWKDKKTKKLYGKLHDLSCDYFIEKRRTVDSTFTETENAFLLFLSACSAVNDDRNEIEQFDVIRAYKTYFKLLNTDITKLV